MNNTKTKQIIAGLPDGVDVWTVDNDMVPVECVGTTDALKALAAAVPEWVPVSERLPTEAGMYLTAFFGGGRWLVDTTRFTPDGDGWSENARLIRAWMPIPHYQEDKDDIEEKIRKVTERGDAITGDEFEGQRR